MAVMLIKFQVCGKISNLWKYTSLKTGRKGQIRSFALYFTHPTSKNAFASNHNQNPTCIIFHYFHKISHILNRGGLKRGYPQNAWNHIQFTVKTENTHVMAPYCFHTLQLSHATRVMVQFNKAKACFRSGGTFNLVQLCVNRSRSKFWFIHLRRPTKLVRH